MYKKYLKSMAEWQEVNGELFSAASDMKMKNCQMELKGGRFEWPKKIVHVIGVFFAIR